MLIRLSSAALLTMSSQTKAKRSSKKPPTVGFHIVISGIVRDEIEAAPVQVQEFFADIVSTVELVDVDQDACIYCRRISLQGLSPRDGETTHCM